MRGTNLISQSNRGFAIATGLATLLAVSNLVGMNSAWAAHSTIVQDLDDRWLAFDAEDFDHIIDIDSDGVGWDVIDDVDAFGGKALQASADTVFGGGEAEAVFNVKFTRPDFYKVYARYKNLGVVGGNDSVFTSGDPGSFPLSPLRTWFGPTPAGITRALGSDPVENTTPDPENPGGTLPQYYYAFLGNASISFDADDAGQIDEVLEFRLGIREKGAVLDRIVFADATQPGPIDQTVYQGSTAGALGFRYLPLFQLDALTNSPIEVVGDPADIDADGDVDGDDFLAIQRTNPLLIPDWQTSYGNGTTLAAVSAVPEPSACLLLLTGGLFAVVKRRR